MKKLSTFLIALLIAQFSFAQTFINEDFSSTTFPPNGWTIEGLPSQWSRSATANAGGDAPEAKFSYINQNTTSRIVSPVIDLTGVNAATVNFSHFYDHYANGVAIGVATRSGGGDWQVAWQVTPTGNVGPTVQAVELTNIAAEDFQFSIFISGNLYNMDLWFIDNIVLFVREDLDAGMQSVSVPSYFLEDQTVSGKVINNGLESITSFDVSWTLNAGELNTSSYSGMSLATNQTYNFTADQELPAVPGTHDFKIWVSNVNGGTDQNPENDTINKIVGVATQSLQRSPFFESFTSSTCGPCTSFNNNVMNPFIQQHGEEITLVKYQMNWPGNGDPYYTPEGGERRTYYGVNAVPMLYVEGKNVSTSAGAVNNAFNNGMADPAFVVIQGYHVIRGSKITVEASILPYVNLFDATVRIAVIERLTTGNVGSNGETQFHHVMMKMLPNANGTSMDMTAGERTTLTYSHDMSTTFVEEMDDLMVAIFVQDNTTKNILQSNYSQEVNDEFPPYVLIIPHPHTTGVENYADVNITFSEPVSMVGGAEITTDNIASLITFTETEGNPFPFTATINNEKTAVTVSPDSSMKPYTSYSVTLAPIENAAGFPTNINKTIFESGGFPAAVMFVPLPGSTGVETFADVIITLSEPVSMVGGAEINDDNVASLITFTETDGDAFPFTATINDDKTVITVSPEGLMDSYTSYTVLLDPVENEAGFPTDINATYFETGMHVGLSENKLEGIRSVQPNPVTNQAQINFSLETAGQLNIEVYNLSGQMVDQIASEQFSKGNHSINWTPAQNLPAGMYIIRMNTQNQYYNSKVLLNR